MGYQPIVKNNVASTQNNKFLYWQNSVDTTQHIYGPIDELINNIETLTRRQLDLLTNG